VLAVSPDGTTLVITDPIRQFVYLYSAGGTAGIQTQFGGVGTRAAFSPDSQTVYITQGTPDPSCTVAGDVTVAAVCVTPNNQLLVHSQFTGWYSTSSLQATTDVALGVPYVGAFFGGNPTTARSYCPVTTIVGGQPTTSSTTTNVFYPDAGVLAQPAMNRIATTNDGFHVLGASTAAFTDLAIGTPNGSNIVNAKGLPTGFCPQAGSPAQTFTTSPVFSGALPGVTATAITGVFPTSDSKTSFVTYTGTGGVVPTYTPAVPVPSSTPGVAATIGAGTLTTIPLSTALGTPIAPVTGVVSADNLTFYAGTSGDNAVHLITKQANGSYQDVTTPIAPKLPDVNGNIVAPNLLVQKPRKSTN
jgi:trimeric autotransporter adhesin